jgi:hypothetical protein
LDCAVLVVGERTTSVSTAKSAKVMPSGGAGTTGPPLTDGDGSSDGSGVVGVGGWRAIAIRATIDAPMTTTSAPTAIQGRTDPFVVTPP